MANKKIEETGILIFIFGLIGSVISFCLLFVIYCFHGIVIIVDETKEKRFKLLKGCCMCLIIAIISYVFLVAWLPLFVDKYGKSYPWVAFALLSFTVLIVPGYVALIGFRNTQKNQEIDLKEKTGIDATIIETYQEDDEIDTMIVKYNCDLEQLKKKKGILENALNKSIISIERGKDHQTAIIKATTKILPVIVDWNDEFISKKESTLIIGESLSGRISLDLNNVPHMLVAGETGSGKSVLVKCLIYQAYLKGYMMYLADFKGGIEFSDFEKVARQVITDMQELDRILCELVKENAERMKLLKDSGYKNISVYNTHAQKKMKRILLCIDEIAEITDIEFFEKEDKDTQKRIISNLSSLARLARAAGINIIIGVQRPDHKVIPGQIKNNLPARISGRFADDAASRIILGNDDACGLRDEKGLMLYKVGADTKEFKGFWIQPDKLLKQRQSTKHYNVYGKEGKPIMDN